MKIDFLEGILNIGFDFSVIVQEKKKGKNETLTFNLILPHVDNMTLNFLN